MTSFINLDKRSCIACGKSSFIKLWEDSNRRECIIPFKSTFFKCQNCGLVFLDKIPTLKQVDDFYTLIFKNKRKKLNKENMIFNLFNKAVNKLFSYLESYTIRKHYYKLAYNGRLLDIGCGNGFKLRRYSNEGFEIYGVDLNFQEIEFAKKTILNAKFFNSTLEECNFPENYFDIIRIDNVLEHVKDPEEILNEILRIIKNDGKLIMYVPNGRSLLSLIFKKYHSNCWVPFHIFLFNKKSMKNLLQKTKWHLIDIFTIQPLSWLGLTLKQFSYRPVYSSKLNIIERLLLILLFPICIILDILGVGDEIVIIARK